MHIRRLHVRLLSPHLHKQRRRFQMKINFIHSVTLLTFTSNDKSLYANYPPKNVNKFFFNQNGTTLRRMGEMQMGRAPGQKMQLETTKWRRPGGTGYLSISRPVLGHNQIIHSGVVIVVRPLPSRALESSSAGSLRKKSHSTRKRILRARRN